METKDKKYVLPYFKTHEQINAISRKQPHMRFTITSTGKLPKTVFWLGLWKFHQNGFE